MTKRFRELRVLELSGSRAGAYAGKLFSDFGATVVRTEPSAGDPLRSSDPASFDYLNTSKQSLVLEADAERGQLESWTRWADLVIESSAPDPLVARTSQERVPGLVRLEISPFGSSGPLAGFRSNEFTDDAYGGQVFLNGEPSRVPLARPGHQPLYAAGVHGFIGAVSALRVRDATGTGQTVEVTHLEALAAMHQHTISMFTHTGHVLMREGNRQPGIYHPAGVYPCKDGYLLICLATHVMRDRFLAALGIPELLLDPRFVDDVATGRHKQEFDDALIPHLMERTVEEVVAVAQMASAPVGPVLAPTQLADDPHLNARGFWRTIERAKLPRGPYQVSGLESEVRPAPRIGELRSVPDANPSSDACSTLEAFKDGPLAGLRVLDLTRVWAGPFAGRMLADLGADVILIETADARGPRDVPSEMAKMLHYFPDDDPGERPWNRIGVMNKLWRNRRGVTLDLRRPDAKEIFESLVRSADVVIENFSPRVMPKLGLDFERLKQLNPSIIYTASSGYGTSGPNKDWGGLGPVIEAGSGLTHGLGYSDSGPYRAGVAWTDPITGLHSAAATVAAAYDREADPERAGRYVEAPMIEAMLSVVGEMVLEAQRTGKDPARRGNRHQGRAPQGVYACRGDERWIAISVTSDREWRTLCEVAELPAAWQLFDLAERFARHDEIDRRLEEWTALGAREDRVAELQVRGVIAAPLNDGRDLAESRHLSERKFWAALTHPEAGRHLEPGCAIRLSVTPVTHRLPAPCLGQHNREVLRELAGLDDAALDELEASGTLSDRPPA